MSILIVFATVTLMIFFNALYVGAEFATVSARRTKISQLAGQGNSLAQTLLPMMEDTKALDRYVAACQLGITISSLVLGAYSQNVIARGLVAPLTSLITALEPLLLRINVQATGEVAGAAAQSIATIGVLLGISMLQVIIGELFPKSVAIHYPERIALAVVWPMKISLKLFSLLIWFFNASGVLLLRLLGRNGHEKHLHAHSAEEIELLVTESHEGGLLDDQERQLLRNAFRLRELTARQVMLHRTRLMAAPVSSPVRELMNRALEAGFSRIPLYQDSIDDIVGFVHIKDLFRLHMEGKESVTSIVREVVYVPETMPVSDVWEKLNTRRKYLAIVFDEFGGTAGLITFEDLIEEIFGELQDEFDNEMALIARDKEGRIYLRGDLLVSDVNEYLELELPEEVADTLSGLIFSELGRPPQEGDTVTVGGTVIRVEALEDLSVREVSLKLPTPDSVVTFTEWEIADHE
jgi:putative hemolysin